MTPATIRGMEAACWSGAGLLTESRRRSTHQPMSSAVLLMMSVGTALLAVTTSDQARRMRPSIR
jgi:hypothetical protein